jgi:hypothetical protein
MSIDDGAWDAHLAKHPDATFYHTRTWARILAAGYPRLEDESRWIEVEEGRAALPLHTWRRMGGLLATRQSAFPFLYGGPVPRRIAGRDLLAETLSDLGRGGRSLVLLSNPFSADPPPSPAPAVLAIEDATHLRQLPSREEAFWDSLTSAQRNDVRRLAKKGVILRIGGVPAEIHQVYSFYRASFDRWGGEPGMVYPESLYQAMVALGGPAVRLYLAEYEDRLIGGAFVVRWNGRAHYHAGYFDHEARALRPNVLLQERIIRDAIIDGFLSYDFLPSGGNAGVEGFKESFGGLRTPVTRYVYRTRLHRIADRIRAARRSHRIHPPRTPDRSRG